jgi:hypothetical protein
MLWYIVDRCVSKRQLLQINCAYVSRTLWNHS